MSTLLADLRYGIRTLARTPRVTLVALLSLALGIGANTAMFTVIKSVILEPLPYQDPDRLVVIWETAPDTDRRLVAPANFVDWRRDAESFAGLAAWDIISVNLTGRERPERLRAVSGSGSLFEVLGVSARAGRAFTPEDDRPGAPEVGVLTHRSWHRMFDASPVVLGETLTLDGRTVTIVGVAPPDFHLERDVDLYLSGDRGVPRSYPFPGDLTQVRDSHLIYVVGRLKPGVSVEEAQAELSTIMRRLETIYHETNTGLGARVVPMHEDMIAESRPALLLLFGAVAFLLLIACVNVANLLIGRAVTRQRELSIRVSLGASRGRLVRQLLTETALLALAGAGAGLLLASWVVDALISIAPDNLPRLLEVRPDAWTVLFTIVVALATTFLFGLVPALHASRVELVPSLQGSSRSSETRAGRRLHYALVVSELALAQILLAGAALLIASFVKVQNVELGFEPERLVAVELTLPSERYADPARKAAFYRQVLDRLGALPGVRSAAMGLTVPLRGAVNRGFWIEGRPDPPPGFDQSVDFQLVSPGYFQTLGIPLVRGRAFTDYDDADAPRVAVISVSFAARYWPGEDPLGRRVKVGGDRGEYAEIVGIVGDVRQRDPARPPEPLLYMAYLQDREPWNWAMFALRTDLPAAALLPAIRAAVAQVDPDQPVARVRTMEEIAGTLLAARRFNTLLLAIFSGLALVLAVIGTYGVMAYSVTRRTREIGVRMALGARPGDVLRMVLRQGAVLVTGAVALGLGGALLTNRLLAAQLFGVSATDPGVMAAGAAALIVIALAACYVPARRAMHLEPLSALRED